MNMITSLVFLAVCIQWVESATVGASYLNLRSDAKRRALLANAAQTRQFEDRDLLEKMLENLNKRRILDQWRITSNDFKDSPALKKSAYALTKLDNINDLVQEKIADKVQEQDALEEQQMEKDSQLAQQKQDTQVLTDEEKRFYDNQQSTKDSERKFRDEKQIPVPNDSNFIRMIRRNRLPYKSLQKNLDTEYL